MNPPNDAALLKVFLTKKRGSTEALRRMTRAGLRHLRLVAAITTVLITAAPSPGAEPTAPAPTVEKQLPKDLPWPHRVHLRLRPSTEPKDGDPPLIATLKKASSPWQTGLPFKRMVESAGDLNAIRDADGRTPLHWAVIRRQDDSALFLMLRGADVNAEDAFGMTPLFYAIGSRSDETQQLLLLRGANLNHRAQDGATPLLAAIVTGPPKAVDLLLWAGAEAVIKGQPPEQQPLQIARSQQSSAIVTLLEEALGQRPTLQNAPRHIPTFVKDALHKAAQVADFEKLDAFLQSGAPVDLPDEKGRTPLFDAIRAAQHDVIFYLLMLGSNANTADNRGSTSFMATMGWLGSPFEADRRNLLARSASAFTIRKDGFNELTWALERDNEHGARWCLMLGADARQMTARGTPFQIAFKAGRQRMMDLLREFGVDEPVEWSDDPAWNLHNSVRRGDVEGVKQWLAHGVDINTPDQEGHSPLIMAIATRNENIADLLMERGADINFRNAKNNATPIYMTMIWDYHGMTLFRERLFEAGAEIDVPVGKGRETPLMRGIWHHPTKPLEQIIEFGADINARNAEGLTPVGIAMKKGFKKTEEYLRSLGGHE